MLTSITWFQFLLYAALALSVYYLCVLAFLYRKKRTCRNSCQPQTAPFHPGPSLMGPASDDDVSFASTAELQVAPPRETATGTASTIQEPLEALHAFMAEVEPLFSQAATYQDKGELLSLLKLLLSHYHCLAQENYKQATCHLLLARCTVTLSYPVLLDDLLPLWEAPALESQDL